MAWNASILHAEAISEFSKAQGLPKTLECDYYLYLRGQRRKWQANYRHRHPDRIKAKRKREYQRLRADPVRWASRLRGHREWYRRTHGQRVVMIRRCPICLKTHFRHLSKFCSDKCRQTSYYRKNKQKWTEGYSPVSFKRLCHNCLQMGHYKKTCPLVIVKLSEDANA